MATGLLEKPAPQATTAAVPCPRGCGPMAVRVENCNGTVLDCRTCHMTGALPSLLLRAEQLADKVEELPR